MLAKTLNNYYQHHQNLFSQITALLGTSLILFGLGIVLNWLELTVYGLGSAPVTWILIVGLTLYYCLFDWQVALITGCYLLLLALISFFAFSMIPSLKGFYYFLGCFLLGWFVQLLGYVFNRTAILSRKTIWLLLVMPLGVILQTCWWFGFKREWREPLTYSSM